MICTSYDEFLQDKDTTVWVVELSDGTSIYCDDGRYGEEDKAWNRLRTYLRSNEHLKIQKIRIKFRSHVELAAERGPNTKGWYFGRGASAWVGCPTLTFMIIGTVEKIREPLFDEYWNPNAGLVAKTTKWRVPEIIKDESDDREPVDYLENIIWD